MLRLGLLKPFKGEKASSHPGPLVLPRHICSGRLVKSPAVRAWICTMETDRGHGTGGGRGNCVLYDTENPEGGNSRIYWYSG